MKKLAQRMLSVSAAICSFLAYATPMSAQDFGAGMLFGLGKSALSEGKELLDEAPDRLEEFLQSAEQGQTFLSAVECLGALQVGVNAGSIIANILPFSSVETFEDKRGPVAKFRVLLNGNKVHLEAFCDKKTMSAVPLPWANGNPAPERITQSSIDAIAGLLLLLQMQGVFGNDVESERFDSGAKHPRKDKTKPAGWEMDDDEPGAEVYSFESDPFKRAFLKIRCFDDGWGAGPSLSYYLGRQKTLFKKSQAINLVTITGGQPVKVEIAAKVENSSASFYENDVVKQLISALASNEGETLAIVVETFDGPLRMVFPMDGFQDAMRPVAAYCPIAAEALENNYNVDKVSEAIDTALATAGQTPEPSNSPSLTSGEKSDLIFAVSQCWNVGSLSTEALTTTVVVGVQMTEEATPIVSSIRMLSFSGGSDRAAQQAFQAARRAIIKCGASGYDLPEDWIVSNKEVIVTFNVERMRIR